MKKRLLAVILSLMLLGSFALFAACETTGGDTNGGKIEGDYTEATDEELNEAVASIDFTKLFGDTSAEDWKFGLSLNAKADLEESMDVDGSTYTGTANATVKYDFTAEKGTDAAFPFELKGAGEGEGKITDYIADEEASGESTEELSLRKVEYTASAKAYNDSDYFYLDPAVTIDGEKQESISATRFAISDILYELGLGGSIDAVLPDEDGTIMTGLSAMSALPGTGSDSAENPLPQVIAMLKQFGCKFGIDTSDGVKIRVTADKAAIENILNMALAGQLPSSVTAASFAISEDAMIEVYAAVAADGMFSGIAVNANLGATIPQAVTGAPFAITVNANVELSLVYDGDLTVSLEGLNPDDYDDAGSNANTAVG